MKRLRLVASVVPYPALCLITYSAMASNNGASVEKTPYGITASNIPIDQYTLTNANGLQVTIITYGAIVTSVSNPGTRMPDIVLGFNNLNDYETKNSPHFGATIGRYANRIAN